MKRNNGGKGSRTFYSSLKWTSRVCTAISVLALLGVVAYVLIDGLNFDAIKSLFDPESETPIMPALVGTFALVCVSLLIAVPLGMFTAIFMVEYMAGKGKIVKIVRVATETLAGIPSIVYGLFGYLVFVQTLGLGYSLLGGGITLAIMVLPVIVRSTEESLLAVPNGFREGSYALGSSKVRTIFKVVLPSASSGIVTSIILAVGRVLSESAVLILTIGMVAVRMPESILSPGTSLALDIYYYANTGNPEAAAATAVLLLIVILAVNALAGLVGKILKNKTGEK